MNYPQIMSPVPYASKSGGHVPAAPMGAPPMLLCFLLLLSALCLLRCT